MHVSPNKPRVSLSHMVFSAMFAALLAVISQISLPMPVGVPITIQVFGVALIGVVLGWKLGALSVLIYILIGLVGVPVFANFQAGPGVLMGFTGGYIISWPFMVILCGIRPQTQKSFWNFAFQLFFALLGLFLCEFIGGLQWSLLSGTGMKAIAIYSLTAFIPKDMILVVLAVLFGRQIRRPLIRAGWL